jgi:hypothetical protein
VIIQVVGVFNIPLFNKEELCQEEQGVLVNHSATWRIFGEYFGINLPMITTGQAMDRHHLGVKWYFQTNYMHRSL